MAQVHKAKESVVQKAPVIGVAPSVPNPDAIFPPGSIFPTPDQTAKNAVRYARTLNQLVEHGGWIYPKDGGYTYNCTSGNPAVVPNEKLEELRKHIPSPDSGWHVHTYEKDPITDKFRYPHISLGDKKSAAYYKVPVYLGSPNGKIYVYDPRTEKTRTLK
jgi:hypothetical protein